MRLELKTGHLFKVAGAGGKVRHGHKTASMGAF